jgi:hypothetical protein
MRVHMRRWGAIYLLLALFLGSWMAQLWCQVVVVSREARDHGGEFSWPDFWPHFFAATFENWQSEWLQLVIQGAVLLGMKHLIFKADAQDEERVEAKLDRLLLLQGVDPGEIEAEVESRARTLGRAAPSDR